MELYDKAYRMQKRYIIASIVYVLIIMISIIIRMILIQYFDGLKDRYIISIYSSVVFPAMTEMIIFIASGGLLVSILSFWIRLTVADVRVFRIIGFLLVTPAMLTVLECFVQEVLPHNLVFIAGVVLHRWLWILFFWALPFVSGMLLSFSMDEEKRER